MQVNPQLILGQHGPNQPVVSTEAASTMLAKFPLTGSPRSGPIRASLELTSLPAVYGVHISTGGSRLIRSIKDVGQVSKVIGSVEGELGLSPMKL